MEEYSVLVTRQFSQWARGLNDRKAARAVAVRIARVRSGNLGDAKYIGGTVGELRISYGPGYRLYFVKRGAVVLVLLCGGTKGTQAKDIKMAIKLADEWKK